MSGDGAPSLEIDAAGLKVTVIASQWHDGLMTALIDGATRTLEAAGAELTLVRVVGSFELPVAAKAALENGADAVVALGVIIRGGTPHFDYVCEATSIGLIQVTLDTGKPVGFGLLTLDDEAQGWERSGIPGSKEDKGAEAAEAAVSTARALRRIRASAQA